MGRLRKLRKIGQFFRPEAHFVESSAMVFPRIVALQPSVSVTLAALGRMDHMVACTRWCVEQVPGLAAHNLPVLPDSWSATKEELAQLRDLRADMMIASVPYRMESLAAILQQGMPVLALAPHSLADIYADTRLLGSLVHADAEAEALIAQMKQALANIRERCPAGEARVYCEEWGKPLIHSQPWVNELIAAAGCVPVGTPGQHSTADEIAAAGPDVLLLAWCGAGDRVPLERVVEQRGWQQLRAVRAQRMFCVPDEFLNTPAIPSLLDGLACVAAAVQPELFEKPERLRAVSI
jgi:iron complex transport system substrate-binding protein